MRAIRDLGPHAVRYGMAAVLVAATYVGLTLTLSGPIDLPIQIGIPVGLAVAGALHFVLQRRFVFADRGGFALSSATQARQYAVIVPVQYAVTASATAIGPDLLGATEQVVYVATVVIISAATFLFLRERVFHAG